MKIKDTLNLGKTKFKMRGNLPVREAQWQKEWEENDLYEQRLKLNEGHPRFDLRFEQDFKGYHCSLQEHEWLLCTIRTRLGYSRSSSRTTTC